jgi:hypothetical protein
MGGKFESLRVEYQVSQNITSNLPLTLISRTFYANVSKVKARK